MAYEEIRDLDSLRRTIEELAKRIEPPPYELPTYNVTEDGARPHIEHDVHGFHYVVVERGNEQRRVTTQDVNELLYLIFDNITFSMACSYEVRHRIAGQDHRRQIFPYQLELLAKLQPAWSARRKAQTDRAIFDDQSGARVDYCVELRHKKNLTEDEIWVEACKKYPLPEKPAST